MAITERYVSAIAGGSGNGLSEGTAFTWAQMKADIGTGTGKAGYRYNIKADGTYTLSTNQDFSGAAGTVNSPLTLRGYKTTVGDGYLGRDSSTALITTNMPFIQFTSGAGVDLGYKTILESLNIESSRSDYTLRNYPQVLLIACKVVNAGSGPGAIAIVGKEQNVFYECDFLATNTGQVKYVQENQEYGVLAIACRFISSSTNIVAGIKSAERGAWINCLVKGSGSGTGLFFDSSNRAPCILNCTITGWVDGFKFTATTGDQPSVIIGNMLTDNSGYGLNYVSGNCITFIGPNRTRDNALGDVNNPSADWAQCGRILPIITTDTGGTETDYTSAAANNYTLLATSPGKGKNVPPNVDLGAFPHKESAVAAAAAFHPLASFIVK